MSSQRLPDASTLDPYHNVDSALSEVASLAPTDGEENRPRDSTWPFLAARRKHALEPVFLPEPPRVMQPPATGSVVLRMVLVAGVITAGGFAAMAWLWPAGEWSLSMRPASVQGTTSPASSEVMRPVAPAVRGARAPLSGRGVPLGLTLQGEVSPEAAIFVSGLPSNMGLSVGEANGAHGWRLPASRLNQAMVHAQPGFVGSVDLEVEIHLDDGSVGDRRKVRLEWPAAADSPVAGTGTVTPPAPTASAPPASPPVAARVATTAPAENVGLPANVGMAPPTSPQPMSAPSTSPPPAAAPPAVPTRQLPPDEIAFLVKRGEDLLEARDVAAARLALERAAEAGDARAAFTLATTYDPEAFKLMGVVGLAPDPAKARMWYERAAQYGSPEAARRLAAIGQVNR